MQIQERRKEEYIEELFASIAPRYDLLNSILSFNCHKRWRAFAVRQCGLSQGDAALDVCAGTLDLAIELAKVVGPTGRVVAVDFCRPMLDVGRRKLEKRGIGSLFPAEGSAERLPALSNSFDAATIGFALRNVVSVENTLAEMVRVVKPGGRVVSLELAKPEGPVFRRLHRLYFYHVLPFIGGAVNGRREAYQYLPESLERFHSREELSGMMRKAGLGDVRVHDLAGGAVAVHVGTKK
ncbi:MAG TPA: bifunctional demethylmenaquinone methyltransferase/2-methoxy-6-polyprenyl-1,4-benzoquinol methylase UbiE [Armatimonadota bacterium]|nr:bifunctional demethylmenaquinone methyltransferase/2-methoxy-6-polyprenyl-1,4-benzoquinol methylase UbiE [Armatimonadota bacterium]